MFGARISTGQIGQLSGYPPNDSTDDSVLEGGGLMSIYETFSLMFLFTSLVVFVMTQKK